MASDKIVLAEDLKNRLAEVKETYPDPPADAIFEAIAGALVDNLSSGEIHITLVCLANPQSI